MILSMVGLSAQLFAQEADSQSSEKFAKKYFRTWWFDYGRTRIIERGIRPTLLGKWRGMLSLASLVLRYLPFRLLRWAFTTDTQHRFYNECEMLQTLGEITQTWALLTRRGHAMEEITP